MVARDLTDSLEKLLSANGIKLAESLQINLFAKPYDEELEKKRDWTQKKRVRRESFGLKLAIYNKNVRALKLLVDGA